MKYNKGESASTFRFG